MKGNVSCNYISQTLKKKRKKKNEKERKNLENIFFKVKREDSDSGWTAVTPNEPSEKHSITGISRIPEAQAG